MLGVMEGAEQPNGPDNPKRCRDRGGGAGIKRYITTRVSYGNDGIEPGKRAQSCKRGLCLARTWSNKEGASGRTCVNGANQLRGERFQPREWHRIVWPEGAE